ncbi:hypothetical protein OF83DRAFT_1288670 [Amylostereum chailletii]|nr:hypothetical protein OF83DRAFT_1288670 [Amylostereum chailletii]
MTSIQIGDPVPPSAQPQDDRGALVDITVNRLFASSLPKVSKIMKVIPRDVYCSINVGGIVQSTECVDARTDVVWPDVNLHFARVAHSCVFKVELFIRHHRHADESLGYFEAPLASLVEETRNEPHYSHDLAGSLSGAKIIFNFSVQPSLQDPVRSLPPFNDTIRASAEPEQALATANAPIHPSQSLPRVFGTADTSANIPGEALPPPR